MQIHRLTQYSYLYLIKSMAQQESPFFERQESFSLLCGVHSVNNILGKHAYGKQQMNEICYGLSDDIINPHKHIFGGDYDVNALIMALQKENCTTKWFDRRKKELEIREIDEGKKLVGFLINKYQGSSLFHKILRISPRHWIAVRKENDQYYFLDSKQVQCHNFKKRDTQKRINQLLTEYSDQERRTEVIEVYSNDQIQN